MPVPADILSAGVASFFKTLYTPQQITQALFSQVSKALKIPKIVAGGGSSYPLPMLLGNGGNVFGDATVASTHAASYAATGATPAIPPAQLFSTFILNPQEAEASMAKNGAFESIGVLYMAGAIDSMRRGMMSCFYGMGYHEVGQVVNNQSAGDDYIIVTPETEIRISVNTPINIMGSTDILGAVAATAITGSPYYVKNVVEQGDGNYKVTFTAALGAAVTAGYWMFINGGLTSAGKGYVPNGLSSIIPYYGNRSGAAWDTYIATSFYGVTRTAYTNKQAGFFMQLQSGEGLTNLFIRSIARARRERNGNIVILINDLDYLDLLEDANTHLVSYSEVRGKSSGKNTFSLGGKVLEVVFDDFQSEQIIPDSSCPRGVSWIIDADTWICPALTAVGKALDGIDRSQKDAQEIIAGADEPNRQFAMLADKWISTTPAKTASGIGVEVTINNFMNYGCTAPSRNGVIVLK